MPCRNRPAHAFGEGTNELSVPRESRVATAAEKGEGWSGKPIGERNEAGLRGKGNFGHDRRKDRIEWQHGGERSAGGEGRQLRTGSWSGARGQGKRLERGELSHSTVATSSPASLIRSNAAAYDVCGLCQCRLPRMVLLEDFSCLLHVCWIDVTSLAVQVYWGIKRDFIDCAQYCFICFKFQHLKLYPYFIIHIL